MPLWNRIFRPERAREDLDDEIEAHLALAAAEKREQGASAEEAQRGAERDFGNQALVKDVVRSMWGWVWLDSLQRDFFFAVRQLRRSPAFSATVIATLAFGISAATGMFTVVDRTLLRSLPYPHAEQLIEIREASLHGPKQDVSHGASYRDLRFWQERNTTLQQIAYFSEYGPGNGRFNFLEGKDGSTQVHLGIVSPNFLPTLGVAPQLGHGFEQDVPATSSGKNANSLILSDAAWRQMYGSDAAILGKAVFLNGVAHTVVGVMPRGFYFASSSSPEVWIATQLGQEESLRAGGGPEYGILARLKAGVTPAAAEAELRTLQAQTVRSYPKADDRERSATVFVQRYADTIADADLSKALLALLAAAGVLWLIACVNVTNLFLVRAMARQRELAIRGALGASRMRILQQMLIEGLVLSSASSVLGICLALVSIRIFAKHIPLHLPLYLSTSPSGRVLWFLAGLTFFSTLLSAVWPSVMAVRRPIEPALRQGGQQSGRSRSHQRLGHGLVVAEIAMSLALLAACGLLLRTIYALRHVPLGFRTDHILVANLTIPSFRFANKNLTTNLYLPLVEKVRHLPGVETATLMTEVPLGQTFNIRLTLRDANAGRARQNFGLVSSSLRVVGPEAQQVFGFHMLAGRYFNQDDTAGSQPVAMVNREFARLYAPDPQNLQSVLGMHVLNLRPDQPTVVVGVLDDARQSSIMESRPETELNIAQISPASSSYLALEGSAMDLAVRTQRPAASITPEIRALLRQASPELANATFTSMEQVVTESYGNQTLAAHLLEFFGGTALVLCISGLYGLLAYVVSQRTREIALRVAVGAQSWQVVWLVFRQAAALVLAGVGIGMIAAVASGRLIRGFLYGVVAHDLRTYAAVVVLLLASGSLAAYFPARRAAAVNPLDALRTE